MGNRLTRREFIARRKAKSAVFIALYQAEKGDLPPADLTVAEGEVKITLAGNVYTHEIPILR